ncbi:MULTISPECIES: CPBP family intramembrane glutamic endopeptidase [Sphingobacterium]|uniref:CPBP family intramembrane glutamic endopeptidase n=1 Tax=Sphingobacterium tenebrionis TaxID=3111775 RepID=A0ABU8I8A5_9SPHI|nr:CPBP family intramembrane glutamic endopeptidase [Sphingobacterium sp. CZ-2]QBR12115.1 CPBP family intramembrane metalloprotease [Sphingobacterium sp. CZ-2]
MLKILRHYWHFIKNPSDRRLWPIHPSARTKVFFTIFLLDVSILILIFPIYMLIDYINPMVSTMDNTFETPWNVFWMGVIFVPLVEEILFRFLIKYKGFYGFIISRNTWRKYYRWIFYSSVILFGFVHLGNFDNNNFLFYFLSLFIVLSQLIGGISLGFIRVRINFFAAFLQHALWNLMAFSLGLVIIQLHNPLIKLNENHIQLEVNESNFRDRSIEKFDMISKNDRIYKLDIKQYALAEVIDSIYGKDKYQVYDIYLNLKLETQEGISKDSLLQELQKELTILEKSEE